MTYSTLLNDTGIDEQFLTVIKPKFRLQGFTVVSGFEYQSSFDKGDFITVTVNGTVYTEVSASSPLSTGEYYFDRDTNDFFINVGADPNTQQVVIAYELFFATSDAYVGRIPTDSSSEVVHYEGLIKDPPTIKQSTTDTLIGFLPVDSTSLRLLNGPRLMETHLYDVSYSKASIAVYHALKERTERDFKPENIKLIINGLTTNVGYTDSNVVIDILSRLDSFDTEYRNSAANNFFEFSTFSALDPNFVAQPIRYVYGVVEGYVPVNIDFVEESPTTSDNRDWVVVGEQTGLPSVTRTVGSGSTTTTIEVDDATGIRAGDFVRLNKTTDEYREVDSVDYAGNSFDVTPALVSGAPVASDTVDRLWVARVEVERDEVRYKCFPFRDYTVTTFAGGTSGFSFTTSMESNTGLAGAGGNLTPSDRVFIRVYGKTNDVTVDVGAGPVPLGADDVDLGNLTNPITILFDLLANKLGLGITAFDQATFQTLATANTEKVGIAIPERATDNFPTYKDLIIKFIETVLMRLYIDNSDLWTLSLVEPLGSVTDTVTNDVIGERSFKYDFDFKDISSDFTVKYNRREVNAVAGRADADSESVTAVSLTARHLHEVDRTDTTESLHIDASDAQTLVNRRSYIFGDRQGIIQFKTKDNSFFDTLISDVIRLQRTAIPGNAYDEATLRTQDSSSVRTSKSLRETLLVLDDQKGIEDADDLALW